ncbi:hypothetical protein GCM10027612_65500 [Microbispora bryophytorum subsp. camponoti]
MVPVPEVRDVAGQPPRGIRLALLAGNVAVPDLGLRGVEVGGEQGRQDGREHARLREELGPLAQRGGDHVVTAERQVAQGVKPPGKPAASMTQPVGGAAPARTAAAPTTAVVATDPRAPTSQTPMGTATLPSTRGMQGGTEHLDSKRHLSSLTSKSFSLATKSSLTCTGADPGSGRHGRTRPSPLLASPRTLSFKGGKIKRS